MLYRRKIYGECQNCPPQQFTYRQLVFPMVRYLGALAPGLDEGPGAGPQDCREESLTWRWLHSAQLGPTINNYRSQTDLQIFLQPHRRIFFFEMNAAMIASSGSGHRSESNCVMQLKRERGHSTLRTSFPCPRVVERR